MGKRYVLSEYVELAMGQAVYDKLEDSTFSGRIPQCQGVIAFGAALAECQEELRSTLEDWALLGLNFHHQLPAVPANQ